MIITEYRGGTPSYFWDYIVKIMDSNKIIILNPDASIRFTIQVPEELIQWEEYEKKFGENKFFRRQEYNIRFSRLDGYIEFEKKFYSIIIVSLEHKNEPFDSYVQERYLDTDTGIFLPFTKRIERRTPNQYSYDQRTVAL